MSQRDFEGTELSGGLGRDQKVAQGLDEMWDQVFGAFGKEVGKEVGLEPQP